MKIIDQFEVHGNHYFLKENDEGKILAGPEYPKGNFIPTLAWSAEEKGIAMVKFQSIKKHFVPPESLNVIKFPRNHRSPTNS